MRTRFLLFIFIGNANLFFAQSNSKGIDSLYRANLEKCDQFAQRQDYAAAKRALWNQINSKNLLQFSEIESQNLDRKSEWLDSALIYKQYYVAADRKLDKVSVTKHYKISMNSDVLAGLKSLYAAALYQPYSLRNGIIHRQVLNLPTDTIGTTYGRPLQVFMEGKGYQWTLLVDSNAIRFVKDSSLFNGKYVIHTDNKFGYELDVYNYYEGKMVYHYKEGYQTGNYSSGSKPKFKTWTNYVNDTTVIYTLHEDLNKLNISYRSHIGSNSYYSYKRFDSLPILAEYFESTANKNSESGMEYYTSKNYYFNNQADTVEQVYIDGFANTDNRTIRIDVNGDTTELKVIKNRLLDGLNYNPVKMTNPITSTELTFTSKLYWQSDTLLNILNPNAVFLDKQSNIISKSEFIKLVNSEKNNTTLSTNIWEVDLVYASPLDLRVQGTVSQDFELDENSFVIVYQFGTNFDKKLSQRKIEKVADYFKEKESISRKIELFIFE